MFARVVALLSPYCETQEDRQSLVRTAFQDKPAILSDIDYTGSSKDFTTELVTNLKRYGEVEPGTQALWHLLLTLRESVGPDIQTKIDDLKPWANSPILINVGRSSTRSQVILFAAAALLVGALAVVIGPRLPDLLAPISGVTPTVALIPTVPTLSPTTPIPPTPTLTPVPVVPVKLQLGRSLADCVGDTRAFQAEDFEADYGLTVMIRTPLPDLNETKAEAMLLSNRADVVVWGDCGDGAEVSLTLAVRPYDDLLFETLPLSFTGSYAEALTLTRFMIFYSRLKGLLFADDPLMLVAAAALDQIRQGRPEITLLKGNLYARAEIWGDAFDTYEILFDPDQTDDPRLRVSAYANAVLAGRFDQNCKGFNVLENADTAVREAEGSADMKDLVLRIKVAVAYAQLDCAVSNRLETALAMLPDLLDAQIPQAYVLQAELTLMESGDYDAAFQAACHALQLDPRQTEAYVILGRYYALFAGASETALNALSQAAEEAPWRRDRREADVSEKQIEANAFSEQGTRPPVDLSECDLNGG